MSDKEWLQQLKVGDEVIVGRRDRDSYITRVKRATPTLIVVGSNDYECKFRRTTGDEVGAGYYASELESSSPEELEAVREAMYARNLLSRIRELDWQHVPVDKLRRIEAILDEPAGEVKNDE